MSRFSLTEIGSLKPGHHPNWGEVITARAYVSDAQGLEDADLIVQVTYDVDAREIVLARAVGLAMDDGRVLALTDSGELTPALTAWACMYWPLLRACEERWQQKLEADAAESAEDDGMFELAWRVA